MVWKTQYLPGVPVSATCGLSEVLEELLVEDERHAADLLHLGLRRGVPVDEVGRDGNGQLSPELLAPKPCKRQRNKHSWLFYQDNKPKDRMLHA